MNSFSKHKWGWAVFSFWIGWYWFIFSIEGSDDAPLYANGLLFFFPFLVTTAVFASNYYGGRRGNKAFWAGYHAGREAEQQKLTYNQLPDDVEEVDWEHS